MQAVVLSKLDRLGRAALHLDTLLGEFEARGTVFVAVADGIDSGSQAWRLQPQAFSRFNKLESREFSELGDERRWSPN